MAFLPLTTTGQQTQAKKTFAGFGAGEISAYFGGVGEDTANAIITAANGGELSDAERGLLGKLDEGTLKNIEGGLQHLSEHPYGSKVNKTGTIGNIAKEVGLNVATGGLYGIGKGVKKALIDKKPLAGAADALATQGMFGNVAQPTIGTKKTLIAESVAAGGAVGASALGGGAAAAAPAAGGTTAATGTAGTAAPAAAPVAGGAAAGSGSILTGQNALLALSAAGTAAGAIGLYARPKVPEAPTASTPAAPTPASAASAPEDENTKKRRKAIVSTVMTTPGGLQGPAPVQRSVLTSLGAY